MVAESFFLRLKTETPTRVWVNNPTAAEIDLALGQGAVGCTTNPAYGGGLLRRAPDEIRPIIGACTGQSEDDAVVADLVQQRLVAKIVDAFRPLYDDSAGGLGFVSIQGSPESDGDPTKILAEANSGRQLGPNAVPKIPATAPGLEAFQILVEDGSPTIVTEVFSLAQLAVVCEAYVRASAVAGSRPPFFVSPITGIFGDHLKAQAAQEGMEIEPGDAELVGVALSRECLRMVADRGYPVTLLCGGARTAFDLIGLAGAPLHATINWSTFAEVNAQVPVPSPGFDIPIDRSTIDRLAARFDDVRRAFDVDALAVGDFEGFGPVQHFRNNFMAGWSQVGEAIKEQRVLVTS